MGAPRYGIGHNGGPTLGRGYTYRKHLWTKARKELLPTLPLVIIRRRVARAKELGLDYKTYAGLRATTGRDLVAFLFSGPALDVSPRSPSMPKAKAEKLKQVLGCDRLALVSAPGAVRATNPELDALALAPELTHSWSEMRNRVAGFLKERRLPSDGVLVIGDGWIEREWSTAARAAGLVASTHYFRGTA
ncbi:MAG: hypothetical protein AAF330_04685 [Pseudomonadota bacterium]